MATKKFRFSLPIKLFLIIIIAFLFGNFLPEFLKAFFLTASLLIKSLLLFFLPIIVFLLVFSSFSHLAGGFVIFTGLLLGLICLSNFSALIFSYFFGSIFENVLAATSGGHTTSIILKPLYEINLFKICDNSTALITGLSFGIYASVTNNKSMKIFAKRSANIVNILLAKLFTPVLPIFILGFLLKAQHEELLNVLIWNFIPLLSISIFAFLTYIGMLYFIACRCNFKKMLIVLKNVLPAAIVGFSSMSSVAAMPTLIEGTVKNARDINIPKTIIPFTTNTHMLGDALAIPLMAMSLYIFEYGNLPQFGQFLFFASSYVLAKFAAAGVPGGTILIMIPILESKLGFTSDMSAVILTTYLFFDPFCTMGSVLGNGVFAIIFEKIKSIFLPAPEIQEQETA